VVLRAPAQLARYIAHKGSICVDGTSLTVNAVNGTQFDLNIIPQTMRETIFSQYRPGSRVNLEVDVIARYLERLMQGDDAALVKGGGLSMDTLAENGFLGDSSGGPGKR
jgi:riboflavin synthase